MACSSVSSPSFASGPSRRSARLSAACAARSTWRWLRCWAKPRRREDMAGGCTLPAIFAPKRLPEDISVLFQAIVLLLGICLFVVAGYGDVKTLNIPNVLVAAVAVLGFIRLIQIGDLTTALYTTGAAALLFTVSIVLFARDIVGGGDVKLLTSAIFLIGYQDLFPFLFLMSISGLLVSILVL